MRQSSLVVSEKGKQDWVTNADFAVEARLVEAIRGAFPGDAILAEETQGAAEEGEHLWIIDPIDGTTNSPKAWTSGRSRWVSHGRAGSSSA